jgi:molecular chaperone GrpE
MISAQRRSQRQRGRHVVSFNNNSETVETAETEDSAAAAAEEKEENGAEEETNTTEESIANEDPSYKALLDKIKAAAAGEEGGDQDTTKAMGELIPELESELEAYHTKVKEGEAQVFAVNEESTKVKEQYLRLNADFDNYRKRTQTEKEALSKNARGNTLEELLPVIDNFELARNQLVLETEAEQKVSDSYQNLYKQLVETLKKLGLDTIQSVGATFDPELHDAIMQEETSEHEDNTVLEEFRRGFMFGDRLLRPAMVKVAINSSTDNATEDSSTDANEQQEEESKEEE